MKKEDFLREIQAQMGAAIEDTATGEENTAQTRADIEELVGNLLGNLIGATESKLEEEDEESGELDALEKLITEANKDTAMPPVPIFMMIVSAIVGVEAITNLLIDKGILSEDEIVEAASQAEETIQLHLLSMLPMMS